MSEIQHHHLHHHHHHKESPASEIGYRKEEKHHKNKEHLGKLGVVAAGAFALYEKHKAKKDAEHAHSHKITEWIAATITVGAGGYAVHEHHKKKEAKKKYQEPMERSTTTSFIDFNL